MSGGRIIDNQNFRVGNVVVTPDRNTLSYADRHITIEPQIMSVLQVLAGYGETPALRVDILDEAWPDTIAPDESLTRAISLLRKAFNALGAKRKYIKTIPKKGYQLCVPVTYAGGVDRGHTPSKDSVRGIPDSIAVLPFADMSANRQFEYFADGISEEILNALTRTTDLRVAARTSAFAFKGRNLDMQTIASALNVSHILEGSIRVSGTKVSVTAQLINAGTGFHIWSRTYDKNLDQAFDIQDSIARNIAERMQFHLTNGHVRMVPNLSKNPIAYDLFLQGRALNQRMYGEKLMETAEALLQRAVSLDPDFAQAYAELAHTHSLASTYEYSHDKKTKIVTAADYASKALELDASLAFPKTFIALYKFTHGDVVGALNEAREAYEQDPNNAEVVLRYGYFLTAIGRVKQAIPLLEDAVRLDPIQGRNWQVLAIAKLCNGDLEDADFYAKRSLDLQYHFAHDIYAATAFAMGNRELAMKRAMRARRSMTPVFGDAMSSEQIWKIATHGCYSGDREAARQLSKVIVATAGGPDVIKGRKPAEIPLMMTLLRTASAKELFDHIGDAPPAGSHAVLLNLWGEGYPYAPIYTHTNFMRFAKRIGFVDAWKAYGMPDRLS